MCQHNEFEIIYYEDGLMFRRCKHCGTIEFHSDWDWTNAGEIFRTMEDLVDKGVIK